MQPIDACRRLQKMGYTIALDDFVPDSPAEAFLPFAKFVKIDVRELATPADRAAVAKRLIHRASLAAEKWKRRKSSRNAGSWPRNSNLRTAGNREPRTGNRELGTVNLFHSSYADPRLYSARRDSIGSMRAARLAGM
jgi:hypothetical protein